MTDLDHCIKELYFKSKSHLYSLNANLVIAEFAERIEYRLKIQFQPKLGPSKKFSIKEDKFKDRKETCSLSFINLGDWHSFPFHSEKFLVQSKSRIKEINVLLEKKERFWKARMSSLEGLFRFQLLEYTIIYDEIGILYSLSIKLPIIGKLELCRTEA